MALTQVSTAGVKDDAVTSGKIPANAVGSSELADNAVDTAAIANNAVTQSKIPANAIGTAQLRGGEVTTAKLADQAVTLAKLEHGTSSNDGKFLRANNGADPSFETVTSTTINNNADNRVITGSGTANTLNAESSVTIDSSGRLSVSPTASGSGITLASAGSTFGGVLNLINTANSNHQWQLAVGGGDNAYVLGRGLFIRDETTGANRFNINTNGRVGINEINPQQQLHVHDDTNYQGIFVNGNAAPRVAFSTSNSSTPQWSLGIDGTNDANFVINRSGGNSNRDVIISPSEITLNKSTQISGTCTATSFSGSGANLTGISAGITMAEQWRLTSSSQGNQSPLTNWEAIDTYGEGNVGSSMSVSNGIFTYPTTGRYLVIFFLVGYSDSSTQNLMGYIQHTTNNSNYNTVANGLNGIYDFSNSYPSWANTATMYIFNISATGQQKTRFVYGAGQGNEYVLGNSSTAHTTATFIRLAD